MKIKRVIAAIVVILSLFFLFQIFSGNINFTGKSIFHITGKESLSVSITVIANPPSIIIDSPQNGTYYFNSISIPINFIATDSTSDVDTIQYDINNTGNVTITGNTTLNFGAGEYFLRLIANNTANRLNNSESVSFRVNTYSESEFDDENGDGIIEFEHANDTNVQEFLEKIEGLPAGAKINFTSYNSTIPSDWATPSSNEVATSLKHMEFNVNESTTGGSYTIFFNLTSSELGSISPGDVRMYIFESDWDELTTNVIDSSSDPKSFSAVTTHFSRFLIGEKGAGTTTVTGGAVSGSDIARGGSKIEKPSFEVDQDIVKVLVKKGSSLRKSINIKNTGDFLLNVIIDLQELKNVISLRENSFALKPNEEKIVDFDVLTGAGVAPGVYIGNILVKAEDILKTIKAIIEIESEKILFDVSLDIPLEYKTVNPGDELRIQSTLLNLGGLQNVDVLIEYYIKNTRGDTIIKEEETISVGAQASFIKKFLLPDDLALGEYVISAIVKYQDSVGTSSETFNVGNAEIGNTFWNIGIITGILIIIMLVVYFQKKGLKNIEKMQKIRLEKLEQNKDNIPKPKLDEKLKKELDMLEKSYKEGYINKNAYLKAKERITKIV